MADTQRSVAQIKTLLADNTAGAISPQDLRDAFESWRMCHGQIYVVQGGGAAIDVTDSTNYFEMTTPTWNLSANPHHFDESGGNGRLTYMGSAPVVAHIALSVSFTVAGVNQQVHIRIGVNATPDAASEAQRYCGTGADVGSTAVHLVATLSPGDYISGWVRNSTAANDVSLVVANLQAVTMPI